MEGTSQKLHYLRMNYVHKTIGDIKILDFYCKYKSEEIMIKYQENNSIIDELFNDSRIKELITA